MNQNTEYEKFAQEIYQELINSQGIDTIDVKHNVRLHGKSGQKHQIDVYWEYKINGVEHKVIIECKNYNSEISIGKVRDFYGLLSDLTNVSGIMVTKVGYQKGAKKYADYYGIYLRELRPPHEKDDCIVGEITIHNEVNITRPLFYPDNDWAKINNIDWGLYMSRFDGYGDAWGQDGYFPLMPIKGNKIYDDQQQVITTLRELSEKKPQKIEFNNAYIDTYPFGRVKIKAIKYTNCETREQKMFSLDARNVVKAILKDALSDKIMFFFNMK